MRDINLHGYVRQLTLRCTQLLADWANSGRLRVPERVLPKITFGDGDSIRVDDIVETDFAMLAAVSLHDLLKDPLVGAMVNELLKNGEVIALLRDKGVAAIPMTFGYNILQPLMSKLLVRQRGVTFQDEAFEENYNEFEAYLYGSEDLYRLSAPLANFRMDSDAERIGVFTFRRMTEQEFAVYNGITTDPLSLARGGIPDWYRFAVECEVSVQRGSLPLSSVDQDRFWWLVALMKILKAGSVSYSTIWIRPLSWTGMSFGSGRMFPRQTHTGKPYTLKASDLTDLRDYWRQADRFIGKEPPFWIIALQRFSDGVDRLRADEALVDYWIACESLFGDDVEMGELTYKLSLRIARFLGESPTERATLREAAKEAYRGRGLLLHGSRKLDMGRLTSQASTMEDITRRALRKHLLVAFPSREDVIARIENSVLGEARDGTDPEPVH